ncbi:DUF6020 family protein [Butyrivibrio fibrisolvens]|uniref:DUF6020 family protein n=1 Tax=Butyrivibrio fibrisolvens TaxID=831 RepID=UPI0003B32DA4|nr:DUF6020 family protein [Butyrivibrio fibrisolvens]
MNKETYNYPLVGKLILSQKQIMAAILLVFCFMASFFIWPINDQSVKSIILDTDKAGYENAHVEDDKMVFANNGDTSYIYIPVELPAGINLKRDYYLLVSCDFENDEEKDSVVYFDVTYNWPVSRLSCNVNKKNGGLVGTIPLYGDVPQSDFFRILTEGDNSVSISNVRIMLMKKGVMTFWQMLLLSMILLFIIWQFRTVVPKLFKVIFDSITGLMGICLFYYELVSNGIFFGGEPEGFWNKLLQLGDTTFYSIIPIIIWVTYEGILIFIELHDNQRSHEEKCYFIAGDIFAFFIVSGHFYKKYYCFFELLIRPNVFIICFFLFYMVSTLFYLIMHMVGRLHELVSNKMQMHNSSLVKSEKSLYIIVASILFLSWLPYAVIRYPAGIHWDSTAQILMVIEDDYSNVWPILSSLFTGGGAYLSFLTIGSYNLGLFCTVLFQLCFIIHVFAHAVVVLKRSNVSIQYIRAMVGVMAFSPIVVACATSIVKDIPYSIMVFYSVVLIYERLCMRTIGTRNNILIFLMSTLSILLSHKGLYSVALTLLFVVLFCIFRRIRDFGLVLVLVFSIIVSSIINIGFNKLFEPSMYGKQVALAQPFQQICRYVLEYPDKVTEKEKNIINDYINFDNISQTYDPYISDNTFTSNWQGGQEVNKKELFILMKTVWSRYFIEHPETCIDATLLCNYGYYYPTITDCTGYDSDYYVGQPAAIAINNPYGYEEAFPETAQKLGKWILFLERFPITLPFCNSRTYLWAIVFFSVWVIINRKYNELICIIPALVSFLLCLIGPSYINANGTRYVFVEVYTALFIMGHFFKCKREEVML